MQDQERIELRKIGFVTLVGLIALFTSIFWLKGHKIKKYQEHKFYFKDVNGLEAGAPVRWNGLKVGVVDKITPVLETSEIDSKIPSDDLIRLGKKHLELAEKALKTGKPENVDIAREHINKAQLEIMLGQASKMQREVRKGQHVVVEAVITSKDVPLGLFNQVTIVPTGLIGEQYLDISSIYLTDFHAGGGSISDTGSGSFSNLNIGEEGIVQDLSPQFIVLEPVKLDRLIRANLDSAESIKDLTNRFNALIMDEDIDKIRSLVSSIEAITSDPKFKENVQSATDTFGNMNLLKLIF